MSSNEIISNRPSVKLSINSEAKRLHSFNEIISEIGPFQIWTSFVILWSGLTVSWETFAFIFLARHVPLNCTEPADVDVCSPQCELISPFNHTMKSKSIIFQWNLICNNSYKVQLAQAILLAGMMFGCIFFGHIADQLGRRPSFCSACMVVFFMGTLVGLSPWYWFFCLTRFILGVGCGGMAIICIVFLLEYVDYNKREFMVILYRLPYALGHGTLPPLAYFITSWRAMQIATSACSVVYVSYFWLMPESPRWLFITGQLERCIALLRSGTERRQRPTEKIRKYIETAYDELRNSNFRRNGTMIDFFFNYNLCKQTLIMLIAWFTFYLVFYGVLNYLTYADGDLFRNVGISSWLTIPSTLFAYPVMVYVPRRYFLTASFSFSAFCMFIIPLLPNSAHTMWFIILPTIVLAVNSVTYCVMHLYSSELFPTMLRNSALGLVMSFGRLGNIIGLYVARVATHNFWFPALIFGFFSALTGILCFFLPETKGNDMLDTIEESERLS